MAAGSAPLYYQGRINVEAHVRFAGLRFVLRSQARARRVLFGHFAELTARGTEDIFVAIIGTGVRVKVVSLYRR